MDPKPTYKKLESADPGFKQFMDGVRSVVKKVEAERRAVEERRSSDLRSDIYWDDLYGNSG